MAYKKILIGALAGAGLTFSGIYLYKKNKDRIDEFLRSQGIDIPVATDTDYSAMDLKELVSAKEKLEDIIAEKEFAAKQDDTATSNQ